MKIQVVAIVGSILLGMSQLALGAASLCTKSETVYFSCATKKGKIISLCGQVFEKDKSGNRVDTDNQWLQYRFGARNAIELAYPRKKQDSLGSFQKEMIRAQGGQVHLDAVIFVNDGVLYSVESVMPDTGELVEGVSVGDPQSYGVKVPGKRRGQYPSAQVLCGERANTENFFDLVDYLTE